MKFEVYYPVKPVKVNQGFGGNGAYYQSHGINIIGHNGLDFDAYHGQPVRAAHDGICYVGVDDKEGHGVVIRTLEPKDYNGQQVYFKTIYWHLIDNIPVRNGQQVKPGDIIGYADNTGLSTGDHLHFGLKPQAQNENNAIWYNVEQSNGYLGAIDPTPYFNGFYAEDAQQVASLYQKVIDLLKQKVASLLQQLSLMPSQSKQQMEHMARRVCQEEGMTHTQTELIVAVIWAESGMNPKALNKNTDGSTDYGLCQFNTRWWIGPGKPIATPEEALNNPEKCVHVMCQRVKQPNGINDWIAYRNRSYLKYLKA